MHEDVTEISGEENDNTKSPFVVQGRYHKISRQKLRVPVHPLHRRPRREPEKFTGSFVENDGGGQGAMLGPLRDRPPCSPGYALCPLSCP